MKNTHNEKLRGLRFNLQVLNIVVEHYLMTKETEIEQTELIEILDIPRQLFNHHANDESKTAMFERMGLSRYRIGRKVMWKLSLEKLIIFLMDSPKIEIV